jgi:uncharacterized protein YcbK (DUF882 family)
MAWKYFTKDEMQCSCCGECKMDEHFMEMLDSLRRGVGKPLTVTSGYRCPKHDAEIGGGGNHTQGRAVDLRCGSSDLRYAILRLAIELGFRRIGIAKTFLHLDLVFDKPERVAWLY